MEVLNRRSFLGAVAAAVAGATLDPERAVWVPGRKLISIPKMLTIIPPCPFRIYPSMAGYADESAVMNGLLRYRWREDAAFRSRTQNALALADSMLAGNIARTELHHIQAGNGFYQEVWISS